MLTTVTTIGTAIIMLLLLMLGGGSFKPQCDSIDVYRLDLATMHWKTVRTLGDTPAARVAHSCAYDSTDGTYSTVVLQCTL
jgi:Galactose oxidase, central domain